jgi:hypothetical protein
MPESHSITNSWLCRLREIHRVSDTGGGESGKKFSFRNEFQGSDLVEPFFVINMHLTT